MFGMANVFSFDFPQHLRQDSVTVTIEGLAPHTRPTQRHNMQNTTKNNDHNNQMTRQAFTLIELLVVIEIIALLIGILLPALGAARQSAKDMLCKSNMRQLSAATMVYAYDFKGKFPPVLSKDRYVIDPKNDKLNMIWYDVNRIGQYLPQEDYRNLAWDNEINPTIGGTVVRCPNHPEGARSYTLNHWAASAAEVGEPNFSTGTVPYYKPGTYPDSDSYQMGQAFDSAADRSSSLILYAEAWGSWGSEVDNDAGETTWFTAGSVGSSGLPGERFGGGTGINADSMSGNWDDGRDPPADMDPNRADDLKSYIPYYRHPNRRNDTFDLEGGANFAFVDGHVEDYDVQDLFNAGTGRSTYEVLWSTNDQRVETRELGPES